MNKWRRYSWIRTVDTGGDGGGAAEEHPAITPDDPDTQKLDEPLGEGGLKALQAEREANKAARAKLAEYEAKLKELSDRDKTEEEKREERLKELEKSNSQNARRALQYEVAAEKGIPLRLASRLRGDDRDAMLADADELLPLIHQNPSPTIPKPDKSQGKGGGAKPTSLTEAIAEHIKH